MLRHFVCVRLDGRESGENAALKREYGPFILGNVQNRIVSPSGENLARLPIDFEASRLAAHLRKWVALYPGKDVGGGEDPPIPYFATLHQALNVSACDARVLVLILGPEGPEKERLEELAKPPAWAPEFSGRFHFAHALVTDRTLEEIDGLGDSAGHGLYLVSPDRFGMEGEVVRRIGIDDSPDDVLAAARVALQGYAEGYERKTLVEKFQLHTKVGGRPWVYLR